MDFNDMSVRPKSVLIGQGREARKQIASVMFVDRSAFVTDCQDRYTFDVATSTRYKRLNGLETVRAALIRQRGESAVNRRRRNIRFTDLKPFKDLISCHRSVATIQHTQDIRLPCSRAFSHVLSLLRSYLFYKITNSKKWIS